MRDALALIQLFQSFIDLLPEVKLRHDVGHVGLIRHLLDHLDDIFFGLCHVLTLMAIVSPAPPLDAATSKTHRKVNIFTLLSGDNTLPRTKLGHFLF